MRLPTIGVVVLCCLGWGQGNAVTSDWRLNPPAPAIAEGDRQRIGGTVCGKQGYESTQAGVRCRTCPEFTSNAGSDEGLTITSAIPGRFTSKTENEWLLDTNGCEAHFRSFGGVILLGRQVPETLSGKPAALDSSLAGEASGETLSIKFYQPGFRVNDCMLWNAAEALTQVICNEADQAQGEVIGHISVMELSRRGISRWRLLRWYDDSGSDLRDILSVVPSTMRRIELGDGQAGLQVEVKLTQLAREAKGKGSEPRTRRYSLVFRRAGQRLFATKKTQADLAEISVLIRKMLEY